MLRAALRGSRGRTFEGSPWPQSLVTRDSEQLLEPIDEHEQGLVAAITRVPDGVGKAWGSAAQRRFQRDAARAGRVRIVTAQGGGPTQRGRQMADRIVARPQQRRAPVRTGARKILA